MTHSGSCSSNTRLGRSTCPLNTPGWSCRAARAQPRLPAGNAAHDSPHALAVLYAGVPGSRAAGLTFWARDHYICDWIPAEDIRGELAVFAQARLRAIDLDHARARCNNVGRPLPYGSIIGDGKPDSLPSGVSAPHVAPGAQHRTVTIRTHSVRITGPHPGEGDHILRQIWIVRPGIFNYFVSGTSDPELVVPPEDRAHPYIVCYCRFKLRIRIQKRETLVPGVVRHRAGQNSVQVKVLYVVQLCLTVEVILYRARRALCAVRPYSLRI